MLDTVILQIVRGQYNVLKRDAFTLVSAKRRNGFLVYAKYVNNATPEDKQANIYRPRLTIDQRGQEVRLKMEFSAPKLLFKNNLQEVSEKDFEVVLEILRKSISEMGVLIEKDILRGAAVMSFHPSKNIPITGGYSAMGIIRDLSKVNLTEKMDLDYKKFRNSGHGLQYYAQSHSLTFYDKIEDLRKGENRAFDKDQKTQQQSLFDFMGQKRKPEVLRMEVRLSQRQKMNSVLKELGFQINPAFKDIFKKNVCQKILLNYFETYVEPSLFIFDFDDSPQEMLKNILQKRRKIKAMEAIKITGLKLLCKADGGVRGLRKIIEARTGQRTWQRVAKDIKSLNRKTTLKAYHGYIKQIKEALRSFKSYVPPKTN